MVSSDPERGTRRRHCRFRRPPLSCRSFPSSASDILDAILTSLGLVFVAEMGDKTQLLALLMAARFQRPWPIFAGMMVAVIANHLLAVGLGVAIGDQIPEAWLPRLVAALFIAMAAWLLVPDKADLPGHRQRERNAFIAALIAFFIAEMGDKTQIATIALAARFQSVPLVLIGSALGMILADAPVIWLGDKFTHRLPARLLRRISAALFAGFGIAVLAGW
jgi:putative Ca2+/H+ antiporter (TMEM165/GDT1 family)